MKLAIVHIDTLRREYVAAWLLGQRLEMFGYKVVYTSRISTHLLVSAITPDVVILTHTFTLPNEIKENLKSRGTRIYVNIVEETVEDETYMKIMYRDDVQADKLDGIFVWSAWAKDWLIKNTSIEAKKIHSVGSIRNSVLNLQSQRSKSNQTIGVLSRFESLNTWDRRHPFVDLMNIDAEDTHDVDARYYFEKKMIDAEAFSLTAKLIKKLISDGKKVIIRPHPNEYVPSYSILKRKYGNNLSVDTSSDICEFLMKVDVICGPVTSAYTEAYITRVPIISFHAFQKYRYSNKEVYESLDELSRAAYLPGSISEVVDLCGQSRLKPIQLESVDKYMDKFYSLGSNPDPIQSVINVISNENSKVCAWRRLFNYAAGPFAILIDSVRIIQACSFGRKKLPYPIIKQYHYNRLLHKPNSYMSDLKKIYINQLSVR